MHSAKLAATPVSVVTCDGSAGQQWVLADDGTIRDSAGLCLDGNVSVNDATAIVVAACTTSFPGLISQIWIPWTNGQLINLWSFRCLADPADGGPGTILRQEDCNSQAGEIWGQN
jgi:hypothetical protein